MEVGLQELILLKKEFDSDFCIFWPRFCICIESSLTKFQLFKNKQSFCLKFSGNVYNQFLYTEKIWHAFSLPNVLLLIFSRGRGESGEVDFTPFHPPLPPIMKIKIMQVSNLGTDNDKSTNLLQKCVKMSLFYKTSRSLLFNKSSENYLKKFALLPIGPLVTL